MPPLAVLDLDHPEVRVVAGLALDIGVELALELALDRLHPQPLAVGSEGLTIESGATAGGVEGLDDDGPGAGVALACDRGEGPAQLGAADQGGHPEVARKKQFDNPARKPDRNA